jgi:hypothetical protein
MERRCNQLTWEEDGNMVIMTSLDSDTSSGDCFMGILSSENFLMAFSFLATKEHPIRLRCDPFYNLDEKTYDISDDVRIMNSHFKPSRNQVPCHMGPHIPESNEPNILESTIN